MNKKLINFFSLAFCILVLNTCALFGTNFNEDMDNMFEDIDFTDQKAQFVFPVQKPVIISRDYGWRRSLLSDDKEIFHTGIDLRADIGTPVMAALTGVILAEGFNNYHGNYIIIEHHDGKYKSLYAHLSIICVGQGDKVLYGDKIGEVGVSGFSAGPHLHFAIYNQNGLAVDPLSLIKGY
jgi:murein DD-endopeptidase MepM/ murein hydrolase activator NlpD